MTLGKRGFLIIYAALVFLNLPQVCESYTLTQYDRQWVNALSHTAKVYYNRAWYKRQQQRWLLQVARDEKLGQQKENFYGRSYTTDSTAAFIDIGRIYGPTD